MHLLIAVNTTHHEKAVTVACLVDSTGEVRQLWRPVSECGAQKCRVLSGGDKGQKVVVCLRLSIKELLSK